MKFFVKQLPFVFILFSFMVMASCSKDEEVMRKPGDLVGVWQKDKDTYLQFYEDNIVRTLDIEYQDGESIGNWSQNEVYYYEPGYNLVVYLTAQHEGEVYQIIQQTSSTMVWCWVDKIDVKEAVEEGDISSILGKIIGDIINKAQEGYPLNPELYQSFTKIPEDQFLMFLDTLDVINYL